MNKEDQIKDLNNQLEVLDDKVNSVNKAEGYIDDVRVVKTYLDGLNEVNDINIINHQDGLITKTTNIYKGYQELREFNIMDDNQQISYLKNPVQYNFAKSLLNNSNDYVCER